MDMIDNETGLLYKSLQEKYIHNWVHNTKVAIENIDFNENFTVADLHLLENIMHGYVSAFFARIRILRGIHDKKKNK